MHEFYHSSSYCTMSILNANHYSIHIILCPNHWREFQFFGKHNFYSPSIESGHSLYIYLCIGNVPLGKIISSLLSNCDAEPSCHQMYSVEIKCIKDTFQECLKKIYISLRYCLILDHQQTVCLDCIFSSSVELHFPSCNLA